MLRPLQSILFILLVALLVTSVTAQQAVDKPASSFGVAPTNINVDAHPGHRMESSVTIACQNTVQPSKFHVTVKDIAQRTEGSKYPVEAGRGARSAARWIAVPSEVIVPPGGRREIPITISVPPNATGAYFAYVIIQATPERPEASMVTAVLPSVAVEVAIKTRSRSALHVDVTDLSIGAGQMGGSEELVLRVANTGTWEATVEGDVLLYGGEAFPIRVPIPYGRGGNPIEIYPGLEINIACSIDRPPPAGTYKAVSRLLLNGRWQSRSEFNLRVPVTLGSTSHSAKLLHKSEYDLDLSVEPDMVEVTVPPGAHRTVPVRIKNLDEREAEVFLAVSDVQVEKSGAYTFSEKSADNKNGLLSFSLKSANEDDWISVSPESLRIGTRRTSTVRAQVTVPKDRPDTGALVRALRLQASAQSQEKEWHSGNEFGVLIVAVDPKAPPAELVIDGLQLLRPSPEKNPTTAVVTVKNLGGRVARVSGQILLERSTGQRVRTLEVGERKNEIILPGTEREFRLSIGPLDEGVFQVKAMLGLAGTTGSTKSAEVTFESATATPAALR